MHTLTNDLRYALRSIVRYRALTGAAVACMVLGIGVSTTLFGSVNPWLFRPLPYPKPERLVRLQETEPERGDRAGQTSDLSGPAYLDWRERTRSFESMGAYDRRKLNLSVADVPERIHAARVTWTLFPTLQIAPDRGRGSRKRRSRPRAPRSRSSATGSGSSDSTPTPRDRPRADARRRPTDRGVMPPASHTPSTPRSGRRSGCGKTARGTIQPRRRGAPRRSESKSSTPRASSPRSPRPGAGAPGRERRPRGADATAARVAHAARRRHRPDAAAGGRRLRPDHRLRERREPAAREGDRPAPRGRPAAGARREPQPAAAAVHDRDAAAVGRRRRARDPGREGRRWLVAGTPIPPPFWVVNDLDLRAVAFVVVVTCTSASSSASSLRCRRDARASSALRNLRDGSGWPARPAGAAAGDLRTRRPPSSYWWVLR